MISFSVPIIPVAKARPRVCKRGTFTPAKSKNFQNELRMLVRKYLPETPLTGPLRVGLYFNVLKPKSSKNETPIVKPDIDNYSKAVLDAFSPDGGWRGFWKDDSQVIDLHAVKAYAYGGFAYIKVQIERYIGATP